MTDRNNQAVAGRKLVWIQNLRRLTLRIQIMSEQNYKAAFYITIAMVNFLIGWKNNNRGSTFSGMAAGMFFTLFLNAISENP